MTTTTTGTTAAAACLAPGPARVTFAQLQRRWSQALRLISQCQRADMAECEGARQIASMTDCKDTSDLLGKARSRVNALNGVVQQVSRLIEGYADKDVVDELLARKDQCSALVEQIDGIGTDVQKLGVESWEGPGAEAYRGLLPTQLGALSELSAAATAQGAACEQLAAINAWVFHATGQGIDDIIAYAGQNTSPSVNVQAKTVDNTEWTNARYCRRTWTLEAKLKAFAQWIQQQQNPASAQWAGAARSLDGQLVDTTRATAALKQDGTWPDFGDRESGPDPAWSSTEYRGAEATGQAPEGLLSEESGWQQGQPHLNQQGNYYSWQKK